MNQPADQAMMGADESSAREQVGVRARIPNDRYDLLAKATVDRLSPHKFVSSPRKGELVAHESDEIVVSGNNCPKYC